MSVPEGRWKRREEAPRFVRPDVIYVARVVGRFIWAASAFRDAAPLNELPRRGIQPRFI